MSTENQILCATNRSFVGTLSRWVGNNCAKKDSLDECVLGQPDELAPATLIVLASPFLTEMKAGICGVETVPFVVS